MYSPVVLVVGAGPTGLVTALTLAVNGVRCRIIDRRPSPTAASRALGCQPRSMEILAALRYSPRA
jgi:3-(3-hydroxy-phenyl)propionate hydroxylase